MFSGHFDFINSKGSIQEAGIKIFDFDFKKNEKSCEKILSVHQKQCYGPQIFSTCCLRINISKICTVLFIYFGDKESKLYMVCCALPKWLHVNCSIAYHCKQGLEGDPQILVDLILCAQQGLSQGRNPYLFQTFQSKNNKGTNVLTENQCTSHQVLDIFP
jgi:hypothetical protein